MKKAVAYYRTSSAANVGVDKDSEKRQRDAVVSFAVKNDYEIIHEVYDAAVSGADSIMDRDGLCDFHVLISCMPAGRFKK